jgi:Zn-dependent oligopeptidase
MKQAQLVNSGIYTMRQLYLGIIDLTFEDKYASIKDKGILQTSKDIYAINQIAYPEGSNFICSFGHLNGYAANYYGYLWSKVFALDMFSVFQQNGVMNNSLGVKYRKEILEKGSVRSEMEMLRSFLGREPNSKAFLLSIGIK